MGYALFTARKLSLTTRLNQCNANLMTNSEKAFSLTSSIFAKQSAAATATTNATQAAYSNYETVLNKENVTDTAKEKAELTLKQALAEAEKKSTMTNVQIQKMNMQQNLLDMERERLETQLNAYSNELESVKKAEETAIKNSAPKY